jgi:glycosyltransferase involved in cell wall biosynthesis
MAGPIVYDITRLVTRMFNKTPNGIDRVDFAFAQHFLAKAATTGCLMSFSGPRQFSRAASSDAVEGIGHHWGEADRPDEDIAFRQVRAWLLGAPTEPAIPKQIVRKRSGQFSGTLQWMRQHGVPNGASLTRHVPARSIYINTSQFPLWIGSYFSWLDKRPDVKAVFFIHDLLPLERPEFFRQAELERHKKRLENLARFGAAAMTSSDITRESLAAHMAHLGRSNLPILALPLPVSQIFLEETEIDPALAAQPYFVCCGTIEPRKNHLMLLHAWGELVRRFGPAAPKLVLIGNRGWENETTFNLLDRSLLLRNHVLEVSGLSTPALKKILKGARALLMPSFAEGFGLPIVEAMATGVAIIASDIPIFREIGDERMIRLSPLAGEQWVDAIAQCTQSMPRSDPALGKPPMTAPAYFAQIDNFIAGL